MELTMGKMWAMQKRLQDKYAAKWGEPIEPATALNKYLWAIGELAEAVDIVRKATNNLKPEESVEKILDLFARTRNNMEFVEMVKKIRL